MIITAKKRPKQYRKQTAKQLHVLGYRQVSRKFGIVSRVDISLEAMKDLFIRKNYGRSDCGVPSCPVEQQENYYRRACSEDTIEGVPDNVMKELRDLG